MNPFLHLLLRLLNQTPSQQPVHYNLQGTHSLDFRNSLSSLPLYNDLGQRYMPGFWQGNWGDRTGQAVENQGNLIMGQAPVPQIRIPFYGPQMIFDPNNFNLGNLLYGT